MTKSGYYRAVIHVYKDEDGKLDTETFEEDVTEYGHQCVHKDYWPGWLHEELRNGGDDWKADLFKDLPNEDHIYEVVGDLYFESWANHTMDGTEWDSAWELRDDSIKPVYDKWFEEYQKHEEESDRDWKNRKRDPMVLYEACTFYAGAFEKKLSAGGLGQYTPFLVDRGARAKNAMAQYDYGMTLKETEEAPDA